MEIGDDQPIEKLKQILLANEGRKFLLDCGNYATFGYFLGTNVIILNGKNLRVICTECGY
jgi:hypothetical protein